MYREGTEKVQRRAIAKTTWRRLGSTLLVPEFESSNLLFEHISMASTIWTQVYFSRILLLHSLIIRSARIPRAVSALHCTALSADSPDLFFEMLKTIYFYLYPSRAGLRPLLHIFGLLPARGNRITAIIDYCACLLCFFHIWMCFGDDNFSFGTSWFFK